MQWVFARVGRLVRRDEGQDLLEYGMLVVLIAVAAMIAVRSVGTTVNSVMWEYIASTSF
jgi:Flp pilus assembly pilin Flp